MKVNTLWMYFAVITVVLGVLAGCTSGPKEPNVTVTGVITDAATNAPITGARVADHEYAGGKQETTSDASGQYALKTWYEEHNIMVSADGYEPKIVTLTTNVTGQVPEKVDLNVALSKISDATPAQ